MTFIRIATLLMVLLAVVAGPAAAGVKQGEWAAGLNYPGLGLRYMCTDNFSLEARGQAATDIVVAGVRGNYYFNPRYNTVFFTGLEADYLTFKGDESKGQGLAEEIFLGFEYFFQKRLSLQVDFGPALISLKDRDSSLSVQGVEYVVNFGINWYINKRERDR
jgi:hypothetical protein